MAGEPGFTAIGVRTDGPFGRITLRRPAKHNALSRIVLEELAAAAAWFDERTEVTVVVVEGDGSSFCAGFDLADPSWSELGSPSRSTVLGRAMAEGIGAMSAITIASIQGHCIGGGVVLASACDLRLAAAGAAFRIPEVDLGVPLYWTGIPRLVRELGPARTKELVLTGRSFDADEAHALGFVNRVVPDAELRAATDGLAAELAAKPGLVLRTTKAQVEAAAPAVPDGVADVEDDEAGYDAAMADPAARAIARTYLGGLGRR